MSLTVHLALVFHVFVAVAIMAVVVAVVVCGHHCIGPLVVVVEVVVAIAAVVNIFCCA